MVVGDIFRVLRPSTRLLNEALRQYKRVAFQSTFVLSPQMDPIAWQVCRATLSGGLWV